MIEFAAAEDHWLDHLVPIYEAMPPEHRGTFHAGRKVTEEARARYPDIDFQISSGGVSDAVTVCASISDAINARTHGRRVILTEHGAGQSYSDRNSSYVGGLDREGLLGVLVPNYQAKARHERFYPDDPPCRIIGSPRVEQLVRIFGDVEHIGTPLVVVSWHWNCRDLPEMGTAFYELGRDVLVELIRLENLGWIKVAGHHHPRFPEAANLYDELGVEVIESFYEVALRASVYMVDNSSTLFEFAALDRPVAVMNAPQYRTRTHHGLRFWDQASIGPNIWDANEVAHAVAVSLEDGPKVAKARRAAVEEVYPFIEGSAEKAADAIMGFADV